MRSYSLKLLVLGLILALSCNANCQRRKAEHNKIGGSIDFNLTRVSLGLDARAEFPLNQVNLLEGLSIVPQITYYPWFNRIHEFYIGADAHLGFYHYENWKFYGLLNLSYNGFINWENNQYRNGEFSNLGVDLGAGVKTKWRKCWYPFLELRLNLRWLEPNVRLGLMHDLKCDRRGAVPCSKIPPPPTF
jgi:hypothetical protein